MTINNLKQKTGNRIEIYNATHAPFVWVKTTEELEVGSYFDLYNSFGNKIPCFRGFKVLEKKEDLISQIEILEYKNICKNEFFSIRALSGGIIKEKK